MGTLHLKPQSSHGARARHSRVSQAAVASGSSRIATLMQTLNRLVICNGLVALCDEPRRPERLQSGGVTWPDRTVEGAVRRRHAGSVMWSICTAPAGPLLVALWERLTTGRPLYSGMSA